MRRSHVPCPLAIRPPARGSHPPAAPTAHARHRRRPGGRGTHPGARDGYGGLRAGRRRTVRRRRPVDDLLLQLHRRSPDVDASRLSPRRRSRSSAPPAARGRLRADRPGGAGGGVRATLQLETRDGVINVGGKGADGTGQGGWNGGGNGGGERERRRWWRGLRHQRSEPRLDRGPGRRRRWRQRVGGGRLRGTRHSGRWVAQEVAPASRRAGPAWVRVCPEVTSWILSRRAPRAAAAVTPRAAPGVRRLELPLGLCGGFPGIGQPGAAGTAGAGRQRAATSSTSPARTATSSAAGAAAAAAGTPEAEGARPGRSTAPAGAEAAATARPAAPRSRASPRATDS